MSEKNRLRKPDNQYEPDFKPGDWERKASEGRLEGAIRKTGAQGRAAIPTKLQNPFRGPFQMIECKTDRSVLVWKTGKNIEYNVNRLTKQIPWDEFHLDTSGTLELKTLQTPP